MLIEIMNYTRVADERMISIFEKNEVIPAKALTLFSHVLNAQHIWANRILGNAPVFSVWEEHTREAFSQISNANFALLHSIIGHVELGKEITYRNSNGGGYTNTVQDILFHVFNHSTYHRGQIASLFKAEGILPPVTDYIILKRDLLL